MFKHIRSQQSTHAEKELLKHLKYILTSHINKDVGQQLTYKVGRTLYFVRNFINADRFSSECN